MTFEGNGGGEGLGVPASAELKHYHGKKVRVLFVAAAVIMIVAQSVGADLPLATFGTVIFATILVIAAGITNPAQGWIHWVNGGLAAFGTILYGTSALSQYRGGARLFDPSFTFIEALAILSILALYFSTRTVRSMYLHQIHR